MSYSNALKRDSYLLKMKRNRKMKNGKIRRIVYMDESYIHENYSRHEDSLYHPDILYEEKKRHKGRRYCFIGSIIGPDMNVREEDRNEFEICHLLYETLDIFHYEKK